jgi:multiple sugar transport system ATP-binding protein
MARVVLENLGKVYSSSGHGAVHAVKNLSLTVEDGELLVLVGPSGCGKTTTLRLIAGLEEITSGTIAIDGRKVNDVPAKDRDVAMVFQHHALYPHLTARENLAFGLKLRKHPRPEIEQRVAEAAEILDLAGCLDRRPAALSGGQRQRVALGRAMVRKPRVFLFDEPLSNLDAQLRAQMRREISRLHQRLSATIIHVTHDQVEAMTLGSRVAVMKDGELQQAAGPMDLYRRPANLFVAGFVGSPPMNFFRGKLAQNGAGMYFEEKATTGVAIPGFKLHIAEEAAARLAGRAGREIVLGLRPEDIAEGAAAGGSAPGHAVEAVADVIEPLGPETHLYSRSGGHAFVARVPSGSRPGPREKISLVFDMRQAHFFDPGTGAAIYE